METFAKEPDLKKLLLELKSTPVRRYKKSLLVFCRMSVTASLLRLGALLQDNLQMGAFPIIDVCLYLLACIDQ